MTLAELCVRRSVFAVMLVCFLVVLGVFSFRELGVDLFPRADPATVNINMRLPGASPEEMTTQVVLPLEEALSTISGLDEWTAQSTEGLSRITAKFVLERDIESAAQDVREKVAGAQRSLPPNILPPVVQKADPDADPVISVVVASERSLRETTEIADKEIKRLLETVDGVGDVSLTGARERQIRVYADADKLNAYGLTIKQFEAAIQNENVETPGGRIVRDQSVFINASVKSLEEHLLFGSLLASLVVMLFIRNLRSVLIAAVAIPTSIVATFTLLKVMDFTLNNMTLLALTLAVGIVIDDAIVVLENIDRYLHEKRYEPRAAAIEATKEITLAVLATTLSLVIIFLPIAFMNGYARRYVNQFGVTMAFSILVSMLVSFTLTPMLCSRFLKPWQHGGQGTKEWPFFEKLDAAYGRLLTWSLDHRARV